MVCSGAAWQDDDTFLVCGFNAVWRFEPSTGRCAGRLHQPDFNDLRDVLIEPLRGQIHVCNTGLDAVETFSLDGRFLGRVAFSPAWFEARRLAGDAVERSHFPQVLEAGWAAGQPASFAVPTGDYYGNAAPGPFHQRKVRDYAHPNHLVRWGDKLFATLLATSELRDLGGHGAVARLEAQPRDGVVVGDALWVTTIDGRVWSITPSGETRCVLDTRLTGHVGWCRGLWVQDGQGVAVGLTAIQKQPQYPWRDVPYNQTETLVLWLEQGTGRLLGRVALGQERLAKVFALLPCRGVWA